jgi:pimeloyl-ACP methyl ester carboxylesterase
MSGTSVSVRGDRFAIDVWEAGSGTPTVYLHDELLPPGPRPWLDELARTRRVIAPCHPGFGRSTGLEHLDDVVDLAIYYLDFADAMGLTSFDLIGDSFGGMVAAEVAALAPHRVRRLVLVGAVGLWIDEEPSLDVFATPAGNLQQLLWHDPAGTTAAPFAPGTGTEDEQRLATLERLRSLSSAAKFLWPIPDKGLRKRIHRITAPTLVLWGDHDRIVPPSYGRRFAELIPSAKLALVADSGHFPLLEQQPEALATVLSFLS